MKNQRQFFYGFLGLLAIIILFLQFFPPTPIGHMGIEGGKFVELKDNIIGEQISHGEYRCCLEKPCSYCISESIEDGGAVECDCLDNVVSGIHPCGECIGEILEGHGNPFLAPYFAKAIAEKTGEEEALKRIISEKYGIPIESQL